MERNRKKAGSYPAKKEKVASPYGGRLVFRIFLSVLLILAAIFVKQNAPDAADAGRKALSVWSVSIPTF